MKKTMLLATVASFALVSSCSTGCEKEGSSTPPKVVSAPDKDALLEVLSKSACECMAKKNLDGMQDSEKEMAVGLCIVGALGKHSGTQEKLGVEISDEKAMEKLGEKVGMKMALDCPETLAKLVSP